MALKRWTDSGAQYRALRTKSGANTHTQRRHTDLGRGEETHPAGMGGAGVGAVAGINNHQRGTPSFIPGGTADTKGLAEAWMVRLVLTETCPGDHKVNGSRH